MSAKCHLLSIFGSDEATAFDVIDAVLDASASHTGDALRAAVPPETAADAKSENAIYGVCVWTGVDPNTDYFTILFYGLSNGYKKVEGPDGKEMTLRKVLVQQYWRPGDQFGQQEQEFRPKGSPFWQYLPDDPEQAAEMEKKLNLNAAEQKQP